MTRPSHLEAMLLMDDGLKMRLKIVEMRADCQVRFDGVDKDGFSKWANAGKTSIVVKAYVIKSEKIFPAKRRRRWKRKSKTTSSIAASARRRARRSRRKTRR